jgi:hypothetical protein
VTLGLIHSQLQFAWVPEEHAGSCIVVNPDVTKLNAIVSFVTDIILLLMMLAGLLRLRMQGGGMLNLGSFLWKQVGGHISIALVLFADVSSVGKGIIWISLSILSGVPPVVSVTTTTSISSASPVRSSCCAPGVPDLELEW